MRRSTAALLAAVLLLGGGGALAADPPASPVTPTPPKTKNTHIDPDQVICKRQEVLGSRLQGSKVCHTRQEWADVAASARQTTDSMDRFSHLTPDPH